MNILVLGAGGRECAFAWKISQSPLCKKLFIAPGNAGTATYGTNIPISETDFEGLKRFVLENDIDMIVPGPEAPLAAGLVDYFRNDGLLDHIKIIGPSRQGAQLESSKEFAKAFMAGHAIPTASYASFGPEDINKGYAFLDSLDPPYVIKADGLAAGKGVVICPDLETAKNELKQMLVDKKFGQASARVVIEEFLHGIELSVFVLTDGRNYVLLPEAKDYKRIGIGDQGPNTGGMGAVSPVPFADSAFIKKVEERIIKPTISGLQNAGIPYCGFIFLGLMNCSGEPYLIEYNVRMGDPETEAVLPRVKNDLVHLFILAATAKLDQAKIVTESDTAVAVVLASGGYPGTYEKGKTIAIKNDLHGALIFHAATQFNAEKQLETSGGRVLIISAIGKTLAKAREKAYVGVSKVGFENAYYRADIGLDLLSLS
ncbi:MAG: phosphoribosylamine--glycine ligase [Bacteroidales bacterium]|nr:phosphoribosylamine--glycine ligase [Bacteroidales bacterium]